MFRKLLSTCFILFLPFFLFGHGSHGNGVLAGFTHPIFGLDHSIAILGVGILGYILNASRWYIPVLAFLVPMIIGGVFGIDNEATLFIEKVIAFSVLAIGFFIAFDIKWNHFFLIIPISIFGAFHGYAHGAEMSEANTALKYISGYALGTILVGLIGMFLAKTIISLHEKERYLNILGGIIIGAGLIFLLP